MQRFKNILCVATSGSTDRVALERAITLAENNLACLTVVEVIDRLPYNTKLMAHARSLEELQVKIAAGHRQLLEKQVVPLSKNIEIQVKVLIGTPFLEIIHEILRNDCDLVIKTAESGGLLDRVFGSDDMHLLRKCPCPVWLVKPESPKSIHQVLAAVDVDDYYYPPEELTTRHQLNLQVLDIASSLALSEFAKLHIVHAYVTFDENLTEDTLIDSSEIIAHAEEVRQHEKQNMDVLLDEVIGNLEREALEYLNPQTYLLKGSPSEVISTLSKEIKVDLVVMGTVARTGISGFFMGNTAETILNQLDCSVLAIKPQGFKTPVTLDD